MLSMSFRSSAGATSHRAKAIAQIDAPHILVIDDLLRGPAHQDRAVMQNVSMIDNFQGFANVVICDQDSKATVAQLCDERANLSDCNWIDTGKRLVQQKVLRVGGQTACNFNPATFPPPKVTRQQRGAGE